MQVKKILGIALAAALVGSVAIVAMPTASAAEFEPAGHTFGVIGGFNSWSGDVEMTDADGDGIYEAEVDVVGSYEFKVRADGAWDYSWGVYEEEYDRTQNSQTNCNATVEEGQKLVVKLDTTTVADEALANADSVVNAAGFDFVEEGYDFWPVTFEVVDASAEEEQFKPFTTLGVIGGFNDWAGDVAMTDEDGDGVYEAFVDVVGTYEFKVRADGAWDYSWGVYEEEYDRTQNSQTNCSVTVAEGQKVLVKLDTTKVADEALANADSLVNAAGFDFLTEGYDFWPVTFEIWEDQYKPFTTLGVIGGFNDWAGDVEMVDNGVGVYKAEITTPGTYEFKVRADGAWDYSWGVYEEEYDRTQNSQTNCSVTLEEGQTLVVQLFTNKIDGAAKANPDSRVNEDDFNFATEGYDYWPVVFYIDGGEEPSQESKEEPSQESKEEPSQESQEEPSVEPTKETKTVLTDYIYFDNSYTQWDEVYAYWWDSSYGRTYDLENNDYGWIAGVDEEGNPANSPVPFPGTKMTQVPGTDVWQARIPFGAQKIIFSSGKTDDQIKAGEIGYQTADLSFDPVANAGQIYVVEVGSEAKKGKGVEKTKYKYNNGEWVNYTGAFVEEILASEPSVEPEQPSQGEASGKEPSTVQPSSTEPKTGDSTMPIAFAVVAVAAIGVALFASKKKVSE